MIGAIQTSRIHGIMGEPDKKLMLSLIKKNGGLPQFLRKDLWMLSTGATKAKLNNTK